jgi:hypothetical protein
MPVIPSDYIGSGSGRIAIKFNNGVEVVTGFIVKQTGVRRYVVSDGINEFKVTLARTIADVTAMPVGLATIEVYPFIDIDGQVSDVPEHVQRIEQFTCYTVEGHRYGWRFARTFMYGIGHGADQDGEANIAQIP